MGKVARGSRKGKKAWRANISTADVDDYYEKQTKDALTGCAGVRSVSNESLFSRDLGTSGIPTKRKIEKHRAKPLRYERIFEKISSIEHVLSSKTKKSMIKSGSLSSSKLIEQDTQDTHAPASMDIWQDRGEAITKAKKKYKDTLIPAVEVEPPGCSYNPPFEAHQDSLAQAVAAEMQKIYSKELEPQPIPLTVYGEVVCEEEKYFLDAADDDDMEKDIENGNSESPFLSNSRTKRVTRVEHNRRVRRQERQRREEEEKKKNDISKEIDCIDDIISEIAKEDDVKSKKHLRRITAKQERLKSCPPRIGKHKFEPAPLQVLLTEEISGSLRKLKGCCTLARDQFKSLEKRGLVVPRVEISRRR